MSRSETHPVYFYVPENFHAETILPPSLHRGADYANYLMDSVRRGIEMGRADSDGFVCRTVTYLRRVASQRYERPVRQALIAADALQHDRHYIIGEKSMSYRLGDAFRSVPFKRVDCRSSIFAANVVALREQTMFTRLHLPVHRHLKSWLQRLEIDADAAKRAVLDSGRLFANWPIWENAIDRIASIKTDPENVTFGYCKQGRVHTDITRTPRELRRYLTIRGEPLVGIDAKNCQPLILALLTAQYRNAGNKFINPKTYNKTTNHHNTTTNTNQRQSNQPTERETLYITLSHLENESHQDLDSQELTSIKNALGYDELSYLEICESGGFYEHLAEQYRHEFGSDSLEGIDRQELKRRCYRDIFYGDNRIVSDITRLFERAFPGVMEVIRAAKRTNYAWLAQTMQNLESTIFIYRACGQLMNNHPEIPIITIHDCIATTPRYVPTVLAVLRGVFADVGLNPQFDVKAFCEESPLAKAA